MTWIGNLFEFIARSEYLILFVTTIYIVFIFLQVLIKFKNAEFRVLIKQNLRVLLNLFSIYILFTLIIIGAIKDDVIYPFDFIFYTQLCGAIVLWCLFIFDSILELSSLATTLLAIPIGFFGSLMGYMSCCYLPVLLFNKTKFGGINRGGHAPIEFIIADLILLTGYSLFIGGKNIVRKIRGDK
jgi:hypothetical protein